MELREWAKRILTADTLEEKLLCPDNLTDNCPGAPLLFNEPTRPPGMGFNKRSKEEKLPPFQTHDSSDNRAICLHRFAGHELLAVEIMAHALTAFPDAPKAFRKGVAHTLYFIRKSPGFAIGPPITMTCHDDLSW
ncbi:MAG: hypothetical protein A3E80_00050 [Chlamydiae bacterium RIFCSPHIGHO2_12_FULL_49_9]|nr:MAG: hypothetical protein A3E80_00050 [Chlamydiae bacterium RIFCSPHIGHO2_12_FULL_49_9]